MAELKLLIRSLLLVALFGGVAGSLYPGSASGQTIVRRTYRYVSSYRPRYSPERTAFYRAHEQRNRALEQRIRLQIMREQWQEEARQRRQERFDARRAAQRASRAAARERFRAKTEAFRKYVGQNICTCAHVAQPSTSSAGSQAIELGQGGSGKWELGVGSWEMLRRKWGLAAQRTTQGPLRASLAATRQRPDADSMVLDDTASIAHLEFLGFGRQLVKHLGSGLVVPPLVRHQVEPEATLETLETAIRFGESRTVGQPVGAPTMRAAAAADGAALGGAVWGLDATRRTW